MTITKEVIIRFRTDMGGLWKDSSKIGQRVRTVTKDMGDGMTKTTKTIMDGTKKIQKRITTVTADSSKKLTGMSKVFQKAKYPFQAWALSIMFAGMAIMRIFNSISKAATDTFLKINQATTANGIALVSLGAEWEYLKYTIGSAIGNALIPLLPKIIEIIKIITTWIQKHPKLTSAIILGSVALGGFLMYGGMLVLFLASIPDAVGTVARAFGLLSTGITKFSSFLKGLKLFEGMFASYPVLAFIALIILIGIAIYAIIQVVKNWGKNWAAVFKWMGIAVLAIAGILFLVLGGWIPALIAALVGLVLIAVGYIIQYWDQISAAFMAVWTAVVNFFMTIWSGIVSFFTAIWDAIVAVFMMYWNAMVAFYAPIIQGIIDLWNSLVAFFTALWELIKAVFQLAWDWIKYLATTYVIDPLMAAWGVISTWIYDNVIAPIVGFFTAMRDFIKQVWTDAIQLIKDILTPIVTWFTDNIIQPIKDAWQGLKDFVKGVFDSMLGWVKNIIDWIGKALSAAAGLVGKGTEKITATTATVKSLSPPKKQFGGEILSTGLYQLERGEHVTSATSSNNSFGNIYVTVNTSGGVNGKLVAEQIMSEIRRRTT